jgi:hypothetical protein
LLVVAFAREERIYGHAVLRQLVEKLNATGEEDRGRERQSRIAHLFGLVLISSTVADAVSTRGPVPAFLSVDHLHQP